MLISSILYSYIIASIMLILTVKKCIEKNVKFEDYKIVFIVYLIPFFNISVLNSFTNNTYDELKEYVKKRLSEIKSNELDDYRSKCNSCMRFLTNGSVEYYPDDRWGYRHKTEKSRIRNDNGILFFDVLSNHEWLIDNHYDKEKIESINIMIQEMFTILLNYEKDAKIDTNHILNNEIYELLSNYYILTQKLVEEANLYNNEEKRRCEEQVSRFYSPKIKSMSKVIESMIDDITLEE